MTFTKSLDNSISCNSGHLLLSFLRHFISLKGKMKPSSYGLMAKFASYGLFYVCFYFNKREDEIF